VARIDHPKRRIMSRQIGISVSDKGKSKEKPERQAGHDSAADISYTSPFQYETNPDNLQYRDDEANLHP